MERLDQVNDQLGFVRCRLARVVYSRVNVVVLDVVDCHVAAIRGRCFEVKSAEKRLLNRSVYCIQEQGENVDCIYIKIKCTDLILMIQFI